ncbi:hypothetical protein GALL_121060 [mine drainage metagenome]|uniref:Uncharacterized protein n=1 Tax=mine drainage metagenome TaxID=410659 RepID=A0A1J5SBD3_9ZZZZ
MQEIKTVPDLQNRIEELEFKQTNEWLLLKDDFRSIGQGLQPINLIKNTFREVISKPNLVTSVVVNGIGLATGILAKKILIGSTRNPLTKLLGFIVEIVVAKKIAKKA